MGYSGAQENEVMYPNLWFVAGHILQATRSWFPIAKNLCYYERNNLIILQKNGMIHIEALFSVCP